MEIKPYLLNYIKNAGKGGGDYNVTIDGLLNPTSSVGQNTFKGIVTEIKSPLDVSNKNTLSSLFEYCRNLKTSPELIVNSNLSSVGYLFSYCEKLENVTLFDTSTVTEFRKDVSKLFKTKNHPRI